MGGTQQGMFGFSASIDDIEDTCFTFHYRGNKNRRGFLVVHNKLSIDRLEKNK
jgi:hypothetical protein